MNVQTNKNSLQLKLIVIVCLLFCSGIYGMAQDIPIKGTVTDVSGEPLLGVSIRIPGTQTGISTDVSGAYVISVPNTEAVLQFSYIGFITKSIKVGNQRIIDVILEEDPKTLDEVVVVGYGTVKKSDVTGALTRIGEKEISAMPVQNPLQAMQGKMAGIDITSNQRPGEIGSIRIRGERSLTASNGPLYVVDGIPMQGAGIETLNSNDIENIDVLKDASATAIYGSRGANGVVIVTTKRGETGKMKLSYSGTYSADKLVSRMEMMNSAEWLDYSRLAKSYGKTLTVSQEQDKSWFGSDPYAYANIEKGWAGGSWDGSKVPTFNWTDYGKQDGITQEHTLSASGGTDKIQAYTSFGYLDQKGTQPGEAYNRFTGNANINIQATPWFKMGTVLNASFATQEYGYDFRKSATGADGIYYALQSMLPWTVPYTPEGDYIRNPGGDVNIINPIREVDLIKNQRQTIRINGSFYGELNFGKIFNELDGLKYRIQFGPDYRNRRSGVADAAESINGDGNNTAQYSTDIRYSWTLDNLLYYDKTVGDHAFGLTLLQSASAYHTENASMKSFVESYRELWYNVKSSANIRDYGSGLTETQLASYMVRLNYNFAQKYLLTVSGRRDGASQLAKGNKWDFFPSAALAWRMEQESFMKDLPWVDQLKLRLGYGVTGNSSVDAYATLGSVLSNYYHFGGTTVVGMIANDPSLAASSQVSMANPEMGWEKTTQYNLALDFSFFRGRINGSIDLYQTKTNDLLMQQMIPSLTGYLNTWANVGSTKNKGIEIALNTVNVKTRDFSWLSTLTYAAQRDEITELANGSLEDLNGDGTWPWIVGQPLKIYYDYVYDGIWKTSEAEEAAKYGRLPGTIKVKDISGPDGVPDGKIDPNFDREVVGKSAPDWTGGFQNTFSYKNFELSCFLFGRFGHTVATGAEYLSGRFAMRKLDYWVAGTNENALYYAPGNGGENGDTYRTSMNYQDGSFIKLRNVSLGYNFDPKTLAKFNISNLKLYVQCINPGLVYSKIDYLDPDVYVDSNLPGSSSNRSFVVGLNVGF
ncbi:MAG: TonB-dependent receptor [Dysgonamonadaceae bacterium]|jgi:TonB-linked SusC/RagA family outer membrane protein|nr:TonB-dependent receptor [Dysgonamonadaceae bacterium]